MTQLTGYQEKGWGYEIIWANNEKYSGKILNFSVAGAKTSLGFHKERDKTLFINAGQFTLRLIDTVTAEVKEVLLKEGDVFNIPALHPHQLIATQPNSMIFEVGTKDTVEDNYKVAPGDTQLKKVKENGKTDIPS